MSASLDSPTVLLGALDAALGTIPLVAEAVLSDRSRPRRTED